MLLVCHFVYKPTYLLLIIIDYWWSIIFIPNTFNKLLQVENLILTFYLILNFTT